jgi:hypothetical protein
MGQRGWGIALIVLGVAVLGWGVKGVVWALVTDFNIFIAIGAAMAAAGVWLARREPTDA